MARRVIDGMVVNVPDEDAPQVGVDIEDALYENQDTGTIDCSSTEEYERQSMEYNSAQRILLLLHNEGFVEYMERARMNAEYHAEADRRYTGLDAMKMQGLRMNRIAADEIVNFSTNLIESARQTPRPVFLVQPRE